MRKGSRGMRGLLFGEKRKKRPNASMKRNLLLSLKRHYHNGLCGPVASFYKIIFLLLLGHDT